MGFAMPEQYRHLGSLLNALEALRNWRALVLLALTLVLGVAVFMLLGLANSPGLVALGALLAFVVYLYGAGAVGIMLMHQAQSGEPMSIVDSVMRSLAISHRLILIALLVFAIFLGLILAVALLFLVCKIPVLGTLLYFVASPLSILVLGLAYAALVFVFIPLAGPAIWSGEKVFDTVSTLYAVIRQRLALAVVLLVFLGILVLITALVLGMIFWSGTLVSTALSVSILHTGGGLFSHLPMPGMMGGGGFSGYGPDSAYGGGYGGGFGAAPGAAGGGAGSGLIAAGLGGAGLLFAAMMALPGLVSLQGYCQIYLIVTDGLDVSAEKEALRQRLDQARNVAEEAKRRAEDARRKMEEQRQKGSAERPAAATPASSGAPATEHLRCPACNGEISADDAFCGHCGHKLK